MSDFLSIPHKLATYLKHRLFCSLLEPHSWLNLSSLTSSSMTLIKLYYLLSLRIVISKMENAMVSLTKCEKWANIYKSHQNNAWGHSMPYVRVNFCYFLLASVRENQFFLKENLTIQWGLKSCLWSSHVSCNGSGFTPWIQCFHTLFLQSLIFFSFQGQP